MEQWPVPKTGLWAIAHFGVSLGLDIGLGGAGKTRLSQVSVSDDPQVVL